MYRRILVPVDGSITSNLGLSEAIRLARSLKAKLRLVHVCDELIVDPNYEGGLYAGEMQQALRDAGRHILEKAKAAVTRRGLKPETVMVETLGGHTSEHIVKQARKWRADLIVIGTHGRRGARRLVMGSDAEEVVRTSPAPVLLVRSPGKL